MTFNIRNSLIFCGLLAVTFIFQGTALSQTDPAEISGQVRDQNGDPVFGAEVKFESDDSDATCFTNEIGEFYCALSRKSVRKITIRAEGYSILRQNLRNLQDNEDSIRFILLPAELRENVVVSSTRARTSLSETAASIDSFDSPRVKSTSAPTLDGVLSQSVGFSLFRRTDSRTTNPTTQGASLRGVNASGASRTRVLEDGVPLNDPFGGWVRWNQVTRAEVERIEVLRGGSSSLYGTGSIGGAINVYPKRTRDSYTFSAEVSGGSQRTFDSSFYFGAEKSGWTVDASAGTFQTRGYRIVDENVRGTADDFANSRNTNGKIRFGKQINENLSLSGRAQFFGEARNNGTPVQKNRTHLRQFDIGGSYSLGTDGRSNIRFNAYGGSQVFDQNFSAVFGSRNGEILVRLQRVPAQQFGTNATFTTLFRGNAIVVGSAFSEIRGSSEEIGFFGGNATSLLGAGGRERRYSFYIQDYFRANERLTVSGSVRFDRWNNFRGQSTLRRLSTMQSTVTAFDDRTEDAVSPQASILFGLRDDLAIYFTAGKSFRAPTLNELYRGFRVGSVITDPNANLTAERATSFETGVKYSLSNIFLQGNAFRTTVNDAVSNVTFDAGPPLILRQRRNAGEIRSQGFEVEASAKLKNIVLAGGYLFLDSKVVAFQGNPAVVGNRIPQVPKHQGTFRIDTAFPKGISVSVQGRATSSQFDDDLNQFALGRFGRFDVFATKDFEKARMFVGLENIFNTRHSVRLTPVRIVSAPFSVRAGMSWN